MGATEEKAAVPIKSASTKAKAGIYPDESFGFGDFPTLVFPPPTNR